ncbi:hypothetical protein OS493_019828 [Desmophyllum pertusum]|uniref:Uncharacterized protein n=1 Tax=Desmophyllum pertusum TaxID=174260 RepID=A0A9W9YZB2_9CNID|nr:hypothetical protein OS493_019828 [Desmophyllum pertusum]
MYMFNDHAFFISIRERKLSMEESLENRPIMCKACSLYLQKETFSMTRPNSNQ